MAKGKAEFDIIVYGASGFTGRLVAEYLAKQRRLGRVPHWVCDPARRLDQPWFTVVNPTDAMREFLSFSSPAEFASRNIFSEERPLRRARGLHES